MTSSPSAPPAHKRRLTYLAHATLLELGMFFNWSHGLVPWELVSDHVLPCYTLENEIDMFGACDTFGAGFLIGSIT